MKTFSLALLSSLVIGVLPGMSHEHLQPMHFNIEQRLHQIDSSLLLRQYEQLKMHAFEARMKLDLLDLEPHHDSKESKQRRDSLGKKANLLQLKASKIREMAIKQMEKGKKLAEQNRMATMRAIDDRRRMQHGWQKREQIKPGAEAIGKKPDCQKSECKSPKGKEKK